MRGGDGDAAGALFGRGVDLIVGFEGAAETLRTYLGERSRQRGLAVIDVTNRSDVDVRLVTREFFFGHDPIPLT